MKPKPPGSRPRCLQCNRELKPNYGFDAERPWFWSQEDGHQKQLAWNREHKIFKGTYGRYRDNRFCGLGCGYEYAIAHTTPPKDNDR